MVTPPRSELKMVGANLPPEWLDRLRTIKAMTRKSHRLIVAEALNEYAAKLGLDPLPLPEEGKEA